MATQTQRRTEAIADRLYRDAWCFPQLVQMTARFSIRRLRRWWRPDGAQLTYADLDWRSSWLAGYLHSLGVGPEVAVAICLERSFDFVGLRRWRYGKAGGAIFRSIHRGRRIAGESIVEDSAGCGIDRDVATGMPDALRGRY